MKRRLVRALRFIDSFIPAGLGENDHVENLYRARVILVVPFTVGLAHIYSCLTLLGFWNKLDSFHWILWVAVVSVVLLLSSTFLFRRTASFEISANLYALGATLSMFSLVLVSGGVKDSPFTIMLPFVVLFTFIMASIYTALIWGCVGLLAWGIGINIDGVDYPNLIPEAWMENVRMATVFNAGLCMMGILWFFDLFHRHLLRRLQVERDRAVFSAARDPLTGLANRKTFEKRLTQLVEHYQLTGTEHAVLLMDLDDFKQINDCHGHASGDLLLKAVAVGLKGCVRNSDLAARLGGDEFGVLLYDMRNSTDLESVLKKIHSAVTRQLILVDGEQVTVGASIGAALIPHDGEDPENLMHSADRAMYRAKEKSRAYVFVRELVSCE